MNITHCLLAALLLTPAAAGPAVAQTRPDLAHASLEDLLNITVTIASRVGEGLADAPARVQVVTGAQIQRRGYRSLADLLKDLPDFKVDIGGDQDYPTQLTVQGTRSASMVVLLLNGVRIGSPTSEPLPILANYPVHSARQVEILYGPASALYGADAFSAVINIISRDVTDAPGLEVGTSVGQAGLYNQTASYGIKLGANASLMLAGQFLSDRQPDLSRAYPSDFQGMQAQHSGTFNTIFGPMTSNRPVSPEYDIPLSAHSIEATLRAGGLQLMLFENRSRVSTTPAYTPDNGVYNPDAFNINKLLVAAATYTHPIGRVTSTSMLTVSRHELDPQSGYWNVYSNLERSYKYAYGSMAKVEQQFSWKATPALTITSGGTFERFYAIPQGADLNAPITSQDAPGTILDTTIPDDLIKLHYSNTGAFAQLQAAVTPAITLTLGTRADYNSRYGATVNPRAGLVVRPATGTTMKVLYGSAYLAPSPYQEYAHYGSFYSTDGGHTYASDYWHLPNPDLKPQQKKTIEGDLLQSLTARFTLSASVFYSRLTNLLQESDADRSYAGLYHGWPVAYIDFAVNEGHATRYGAMAGLEYLYTPATERRIEAHAALAFANGRDWEQDEDPRGLPVGAMSPLQLRFGADVDWDHWSFAPRLALVGPQRLLATMPSDPSTRLTLAGYAVVDVNVRRSVSTRLDAFVTVENLLDQRYRNINARAYLNPEELIGAPQNPRRIAIGFDLRIRSAGK